MKTTRILALVAALAGTAAADTITTKSGSVLNGTVKAIAAGSVTLDTPFAGAVDVKIADIGRVSTVAPLNIRLADGSLLRGVLETTAGGVLTVGGQPAALDKIARGWDVGAPDPDVEAQKRKWAFEVALDVAGKTGTSEQFGGSLSASATLTGPVDRLRLYTAYNYQKISVPAPAEDTKSADQFRFGGEYNHTISENTFWYVRDELGFDRVKAIEFTNVAAAGLGHKLINQPKHLLSFRAGLSHRFESYEQPAGGPRVEDFNDLGLDFGLDHEWTFSDSKIVTHISYVPSVAKFSDYVIHHESYYELPLKKALWKFRVGISNDYTSTPVPATERLDTTYFARLVFAW
ncbi:MAG: DUF481 domain-containing protein [Opitutaceae bacterium]|jgi:putative salt-induced outer membrane protein YdiY|nr:DUF481 domain-containing protein [Opitutaceae bacterium]